MLMVCGPLRVLSSHESKFNGRGLILWRHNIVKRPSASPKVIINDLDFLGTQRKHLKAI